MKNRAITSLFSIFILSTCLLTGCGSSKKDDKLNLKDVSGTYVCHKVIVNKFGVEAGYSKAKVNNHYEGMEITIDNDKLRMDGMAYKLIARDDETILVEGSGYTESGDICNKDFEGPMYFYYYPDYYSEDGNSNEKSDFIGMYYTPIGTTDWFFALDFHKK